ncbi:YopJ family acetyltransferase [Candidatus Berkiella aquae]|uniref:Uncharacterized protein n=1 Tax=Candidatus Berkiella aquae TaxID=295108 RepID=A0A0Q9YL34_9GAMM|nr:hypothetical protein [Candidatus Berkiella aquae]MCS5710912.1 hypothetical protein [Candidatus Berkiella aquae]
MSHELESTAAYDAIRQLIIQKLPDPKQTARNRWLGTLNGLHELHKDYDRFVKLGNYKLEGKLEGITGMGGFRAALAKAQSEEQKKKELAAMVITLQASVGTERLEQLKKDFDFSSLTELAAWLVKVYDASAGIAPSGKMKGISSTEKAKNIGLNMDIHVSKTGSWRILTCDEAKQRDSSGTNLQFKTWEETIQQMTDDFLITVAAVEKYNMWDVIKDEALGCGQARMDEFIILRKKVEETHSLVAFDNLKEELLTGRIVPELHASKKDTTVVTKPEPLQEYMDPTRKQTGRVPNANGLCLIAEHLKNTRNEDIYIAENSEEVSNLLHMMSQNEVKPGAKIAVQGLTGDQSSHWYALMIEKERDGKLNLVLMDSLGDGTALRESSEHAAIEIFKEFKDKHPEYHDSELYQNIELVQFDYENCGSFSMKFCERMLKEKDFVKRLKEEGYVIEDASARVAMGKGRQKLDEVQITKLYEQKIKSYVLPPEYFSYNQRKKYAQYYERGENFQSKIEEQKRKISERMNKEFKYELKETVDGECIVTAFQKSPAGKGEGGGSYDVNMRMVYFRNKYWERAIQATHENKNSAEISKIIENRKAKNISIAKINLSVNQSPSTTLVKEETATLENKYAIFSPVEAEFELKRRNVGNIQIKEAQKLHDELTTAAEVKSTPVRAPTSNARDFWKHRESTTTTASLLRKPFPISTRNSQQQKAHVPIQQQVVTPTEHLKSAETQISSQSKQADEPPVKRLEENQGQSQSWQEMIKEVTELKLAGNEGFITQGVLRKMMECIRPSTAKQQLQSEQYKNLQHLVKDLQQKGSLKNIKNDNLNELIDKILKTPLPPTEANKSSPKRH